MLFEADCRTKVHGIDREIRYESLVTHLTMLYNGLQKQGAPSAGQIG
jgi:hypothetical protein